ncbi:MAG: methyltransferase [Bacteroidales bacterium]|nr:methyltransferase [Bacteroidales bacterium]
MFHFRKFSIDDNLTAMKVGTDAVLLGCWTEPGNALTILDVGTGTGILALMMAQRTSAEIDAVEIDSKAAEQAKANVDLSPWPDQIRIHPVSFQHFLAGNSKTYPFLISNPPFFNNSLKSPDPSRNTSRHDELLPVPELLKGVGSCLSENGIASFILPFSDYERWINSAADHGLFPYRACKVVPRHGKPASRVMIEFKRHKREFLKMETITIRELNGEYSAAYIELTRDFYLGL